MIMWDTLIPASPAQAAEYYAAGWWRRETFTSDLAAAARERGDHPAIIAYESGALARTLTYRELAAMVARFAGALTELGVGRGDVVVIYLPNLWAVTALYLACNRIGAVSAPVIPTLGGRELGYVLRSSGAKACVTVASFEGADYAARLASAAPPTLAHQVIIGSPAPPGTIGFEEFFCAVPWEERQPLADVPPGSPDEPALLLYTSGTTGPMKGVVHSQNTLYAAVRSVAGPYGLTGSDVIAIPHFLTHLAAASCAAYLPLLTGGTSVLQDTSTDMELLLDIIAAHRVSYLYAAPGYVVRLLAAQRARPRDTSSLHHFVSGSAPIQPQLIADVKEVFGTALHALWGMTENGSVTVTRPADPEGWAAHSDGRPMPWMRVRVEPPADGAAGRLWVRGASQCLGYLGQASLYRSCLDADGWFDTGDLAYEDGRGGIRISGRRADLITRASGQKVSAAEVENVLLDHPAIAEVVLFGYPDPDVPGADLACAAVVPDGPPPTLADLHDFLAARQMARVLWPDRLQYAQTLPKTALGKVQRNLLRERVEIAQAGPA
jgi:cyclohexanecarboxylate-CoA ligase